MQDSVFFNFINDTNNEPNNVILEKEYINDNDNDTNNSINYTNIYSNIEKIKSQCNLLINKPILHLFILNEINYYNSLKKLILCFTTDSIYKIKYYITQNIFEIRNTFTFKSIEYIEYSRINNTYTLCDQPILIIYYKNIYKKLENIKLISLNNSYYYSIDSLLDIFRTQNIRIIQIDSIDIDNGLGITENILNSDLIDSMKSVYYNSYLYFTPFNI